MPGTASERRPARGHRSGVTPPHQRGGCAHGRLPAVQPPKKNRTAVIAAVAAAVVAAVVASAVTAGVTGGDEAGPAPTVTATALSVDCSYGEDGRSSEAIFDSDAGLDGGPETKLLAGRSINVPWGCELPKDEKVIQVEIAPDYNSETAIFTGTVK
ncbi:hypothetical protein GCM10010129_01790 [Streptomyces fumigatiscleroticus]|nr:hypothetical protein GCM10010129_01790 [Streptomyces fumigatiscleroticus]